MPNWKRITLVIFVLMGGTMSFAFWSQYQFNSTLSDFEAIITTNRLLVYPPLGKDSEVASTSLEEFETLASSSEETISSITATASTSSPQAASLSADTSTNLELSLTFPQKDDKVYVGCTYPISWRSSTTINSLEIALVDAGSKELIEPSASGLAKENTIEKDLQNLNWTVGSVWPGRYYIKVSSINGVESVVRSGIFTISNISKGISADEREKICKN